MLWWLLLGFAWAVILGFHRASSVVTAISFALLFLLLSFLVPINHFISSLFWGIYVVSTIVGFVPPLRMKLSGFLFSIYKKISMTPSQTEKEALAAGQVGWEAKLFSGQADWNQLKTINPPAFTEEEKAFLAGPLKKLCAMISDWEITHQKKHIPERVWSYAKEQGFLGMIIPKEYGGLAFSHQMHSEVIATIATVSATVATSVSVPNSLGPAELLLKYGTPEQKDYYLPRLAKGQEVPCFALTSADAGSDAASMVDHGVVFKDNSTGTERLAIRLNFSKRYITLAPVATVIGLAFKLYDPDHLLGDKEDIGITCALLPRDTQGLQVGRRHVTLSAAFWNGPVVGQDVVIGVDQIIGGPSMAGSGWRMLMECLAVGRSISIPAVMTGGAMMGAFSTAAYARIRKQFGISISQFEGVAESLARVCGKAYLQEALRRFSVGLLDCGEASPVASAITKYHCGQMARELCTDAMDIQGGKGICLGPHNTIGRCYEQAPIGITVEGANILTRSMIIFGQGMVRCHPYTYAEIQAMEKGGAAGLKDFDKVIYKHVGHIISSFSRSLVLGLTASYTAKAPKGRYRRFYQKMSRYSACLAFLSDAIAAYMGAGALKRSENISARLGDMLSYLYIGSALMKFHESDQPSELPLMDWCVAFVLYQLDQAMDGIIKNIRSRSMRYFLKLTVKGFSSSEAFPADALSHKVVKEMTQPGYVREKLSRCVYKDNTPSNALAGLPEVLQAVICAEPLEKIIHKALKKGDIKAYTWDLAINAALEKGLISDENAKQLHEAYRLRLSVINVDDFNESEINPCYPEQASLKTEKSGFETIPNE